MGLKYPELAEDELFKSTLALKFNADNVFEEMKSMQVMTERVNFVSSLMQIMTKSKDASGMDVDVPYFNAQFVIEKYLKLDPSDIKENNRLNKEKEIEDLAYMKKQQDIQASSQGGGMGGF
jgi:hypothetical protein